jgi:hypothetical protein
MLCSAAAACGRPRHSRLSLKPAHPPAQALLRHVKGRLWARGELSALDPFVLQLLTLFWDDPSPAHPFSLHRLCAAGAPAG